MTPLPLAPPTLEAACAVKRTERYFIGVVPLGTTTPPIVSTGGASGHTDPAPIDERRYLVVPWRPFSPHCVSAVPTPVVERVWSRRPARCRPSVLELDQDFRMMMLSGTVSSKSSTS